MWYIISKYLLITLENLETYKFKLNNCIVKYRNNKIKKIIIKDLNKIIICLSPYKTKQEAVYRLSNALDITYIDILKKNKKNKTYNIPYLSKDPNYHSGDNLLQSNTIIDNKLIIVFKTDYVKIDYELDKGYPCNYVLKISKKLKDIASQVYIGDMSYTKIVYI